MQINGLMGKFYVVCEWIMKLAFVNLLWLGFSLVGLIVLGIMPATVALFTIVRKWLMKETDIPIFRTFFQTFKKEFSNANKIGLLMAVIGFFLYFDFTYLKMIGGSVQFALSIPLCIITILYIITFLYLFPVYVHFEIKMFQYIKNSFYIGILNLHLTALIIAGIVLLSFFFRFLPGILPFYSMILVAIIVMWGAGQAFRRIEAKQKKHNVQREIIH